MSKLIFIASKPLFKVLCRDSHKRKIIWRLGYDEIHLDRMMPAGSVRLFPEIYKNKIIRRAEDV